MPDLLLISDAYHNFAPNPDSIGRPFDSLRLSHHVPTAEELIAYRTVAIGPLALSTTADQLAGALDVATARAEITVILLIPRDGGYALKIAEALVPEFGLASGRVFSVTPVHPAFDPYVREYGRKCKVQFDIPEDAEALARAGSRQAAFVARAGQGSLYVMTYSVADFAASHDVLLKSVLAAVETHSGGDEGQPPAFLETLRLPGEDEALARIHDLENQIGRLRDEAAHLARFRNLVGRLSGHRLEKLIIDALNVVLEPTASQAEDRDDIRREDFWIVGPDGEQALAEAKGLGSHVRREDVSQIDFHRSGLQDEALQTLPGLLVVNIFRNDDDADRRQLPVHDDIARHAVDRGVLILRGWDLYQLVARSLEDPTTGSQFLSCLDEGGGWLEVTSEGLTLHPPR